MKKITLLIILMITSLGFSQQETFEITFETGTAGSDATKWNVFENDSNPALEIVANPDASGVNASATVAKFTALSTGQQWAGTEVQHAVLGEWILEASNTTISVSVYKSVISDVTVKFVNSTSGTVFQLTKPNTKTNEWETLTYDISSAISSGENHNIDQFVIFPEWSARSTNTITYFDNVTWTANRTAAAGGSGSGGSGSAPTDAPAAPTAAATDVISIFSDAYTDVTSTWNPGWGQSTVLSDETIAGNAVKKYESFTFSGIEPSSPIDASTMGYINLNYWTSDATELKVKFVDYNGDGTWGSDNTEAEVVKSVSTDSWGTLSIPFSDFTAITAGIKFNDLGQFVLSATGATNAVYIDNIYFSKEEVTSGGGSTASAPTDAPATPTAATSDVISIFSDAYTDLTATWNPGWGQSTVLSDETIAGNAVKKYESFTFSGIEPSSPIDASAMVSIKLDYWTSDATELKVKLVDYNGDGTWGNDNTEAEVVKTVTTGSWGTLTIPLTDFTAITAGIKFNDIGQLVLSATGATNAVYLDNIYFTKEASNGGGNTATAPTDAPTAPTKSASDVISIFSDAYTDLTSTWNPGWGQSTVLEDETIASNPVKKYSSFTFTGIEPSAPIDASSMTHINLNYWTSDATELKVKLVDYNGDGTWGNDNTEAEVVKAVTTGSWGTLSIPFSDFTAITAGINFNDIGQLVLSATGATNPVYIDNIYFSNGSVLNTNTFALASLKIYPNPTTNFINLNSQSNIQKVEIYNVLGAKVKTLNTDDKNVLIDVSLLKKGIYLLRYNIDNSVGTSRFIKQ
ncbi:T9SS type A sorting domain-containing protein [Polaribacter sp. Z022]|uniref:T9SS type A sorting domain-containing protein n=1 Tax=Polaribacter sp. Z022 TaxID=2927125 RepID=UPI0020213E86|nr:T9SS type A sorting domain-containing protein [Polaribacter sp. Z022]MCL7754469.1 T9SS type A sorting domain-containing protein [Polaribacter sp. Z022]